MISLAAALFLAQMPALEYSVFDFLDLGDKSVALKSPEHVIKASALEPHWAPDGKRLAVLSAEFSKDGPVMHLAVWELATHKLRDIPLGGRPIVGLEWSGDGVGIYMVLGRIGKPETEASDAFYVSCANYKSVPVAIDPENSLQISAMFGSPRVAIWASGRLLVGSGADFRSYTLNVPGQIAWSNKGDLMALGRRRMRFDFDSGAFVSADRVFVEDWAIAPEGPYRAQAGKSLTPDPLNQVWILTELESRGEQPKEFAIITSDAQRAQASPTGSAVWYIHRQNLMVREMSRVTKAEMEAAKEALERQALMQQGKQVGIALMIYAADNDDKLPGKDFYDNLLPYLKNKDLLAGFQFLGMEKDLTKVQDPAGEVMGYIDGKYGRAVVYYDSHVKWVKKGKG